MADTINGVPIGDLPGIESVPDDSMLVVEFLGKAYHMPGAVLRQLFQDILDAMGTSVDDVTEARLTAAIETVLASGKYNGVSPSVEVTTDENGKSVLHVVDAFGIKDYPVEVQGASNAVQYVKQTLTPAQQKQARENIGATGSDLAVNDPNAPGYVANRTHWKELTGWAGELVPETTIEFTGTTNAITLVNVDEHGVEKDKPYTVTWNGVDYDCVGKDSGDGMYIGNGKLMDAYDLMGLPDTGEPFCLHALTEDIHTLYKQDKTAETITILVTARREALYHPFEEGYIPDSVRYAVQFKPQELSGYEKKQARKNIESSVVVSLSGNDVIGYTVTLDGNVITGDQLDDMAEAGTYVIGVAANGLKFRLPNGTYSNEVAAGTVFRYENAVASKNPETLEDLSTHWFEFHARINDVDYGIRYETDGAWQGYAVSSFLTFVLTEVDGQPSFSHNGQILPRWAVLELLNMASYTNRPVFCFQKNMRFFKADGTVIIPAMYTPFSLMLSGAGEHIFFCEQDGYKYTVTVEESTTQSTGATPTAEKTVAYQTAESKGDDLEVEEGKMFLLSAGERISEGVTLPTSSGKDGTTFTPNVDESGDLSWTNNGGLPNPATVNIRGPAGEAATIEEVTAESDGSYLAQPTVTVTTGGTAQKRTFHFAFKGLRGLSGSGTGGGVPSDWGENDPSSASHVFRRTHWKEVYDGPEGEVISETSVAFTSNIKTITGAMSDAIHAGALYIVTWNGVDYRCIGKASSDGNYIGNGSFMNAGNITFEDTGEPFCVLQFGGTYYMVYKANTTAETVTVKVVGKKETVWHKLDGGYLPEGVPYVETNVVEILPEIVIEVDPEDGAYPSQNRIELITGNTYTVKWNGTEHICVAQDVSVPVDEEGNMANIGVAVGDLSPLTGGTSTGEPFAIIALNALGEATLGVTTAIQVLDGSTSVTLSISGEGKVFHKMLPDLLPEGTPYAEPFDDVIIASWPVSGGDMELFFVSADPVGKVVPGNVYKVNWGGTVYECVARYNADYDTYLLGNGKNAISDLNDGVATDHPFTIAILGPSNATAGIGATFLIKASSTPENYEFSVVGSLKVRKINEHCLPDSWVPLIVNVSGNSSDGYSADVSFDVANYAVLKGRTVLLKHSNRFYQLNGVSVSHIRFSAFNFTTESSGTYVYYESFDLTGTGLTHVHKLLQSYPATT